MPAGRKTKPVALDKALVEAFAVNERMNQFLLENLDEDAWRAEPPGGKGRTIAAIVAPLANEVTYGMWDWSKRQKEI